MTKQVLTFIKEPTLLLGMVFDSKKYYEENKEALKAKARVHYLENKETIKAKNRMYYHDNKDAMIAKNKEWRKKNPDKVAAAQARYDASHKEQKDAYLADYRKKNKSKLAASVAKWNHDNKVKVVAHYSNGKNRCAYCHDDWFPGLTIDHMDGNGSKDRHASRLPRLLIKRGMPEGYQILCGSCNLVKGKMTDAQFRAKYPERTK